MHNEKKHQTTSECNDQSDVQLQIIVYVLRDDVEKDK